MDDSIFLLVILSKGMSSSLSKLSSVTYKVAADDVFDSMGQYHDNNNNSNRH
jgi:hypothetical protein